MYDDDHDDRDQVFVSWVETTGLVIRYAVVAGLLLLAFLSGCLAQRMREVW